MRIIATASLVFALGLSAATAVKGAERDLVGSLLDASGVEDSTQRADYEQRLRTALDDLLLHLGDGGPSMRRAKRLYRLVQGSYLRSYRDDADGLNAILDRGDFNCVSGSLFFGLAARAAGFDVQVVEGPRHLLPVLKIGRRQVLVETTLADGFDLLRSSGRGRAVPYAWPIPPELAPHAVYGASSLLLAPVSLETAVAYVWHNTGQRALARGDGLAAAEAFLQEHRLHPELAERSEAVASALARAFRHEYDATDFDTAQKIAEIDLAIYPGRTTGRDRLLAAALKRILRATEKGDLVDAEAILASIDRADVDAPGLARLEREACPAIAAEAVRQGDWARARRMADRFTDAEPDPLEARRLSAWVEGRRAGRDDTLPLALRIAG